MKACSKCEEVKSLSEYHSNGVHGLRPDCKTCRAVVTHSYYTANKPSFYLRARKTHLKNRYGLTDEEVKELEDKQNNMCAICSRETSLEVDHSHVTGRVRGMLCSTCNKGLGLFKDNPNYIERAIMYLEGKI